MQPGAGERDVVREEGAERFHQRSGLGVGECRLGFEGFGRRRGGGKAGDEGVGVEVVDVAAGLEVRRFFFGYFF